MQLHDKMCAVTPELIDWSCCWKSVCDTEKVSSMGPVYLSASGAVCVVNGATAGMAGREIHHSIRTTHRVKQLLNTVTANVTAYSQVAQIWEADREREELKF